MATHKVKVRRQASSSRPKAGSVSSADPAAFLRSLFLPSGTSSHSNHASQDEGSGENAKLFGHHHHQTQAHSRPAKYKVKQPHPEYARSRSFPNNLASAAQAQGGTSSTSPDVLLMQNIVPNPESSPTTNHFPLPILKPQPLHPHALPHAFTDPLPLPPRRRRKSSQPKQLTQLPQALVMSGLEHASFSVQRTLISVLAEKRVVIEGPRTNAALPNENSKSPEGIAGMTSEDGIWNLPDGFIAIYVCAWDARERPAIHKTLVSWFSSIFDIFTYRVILPQLDKFAMSSNVFISQKVRHNWNMLLFPPSPRSLHSSYVSHSNPGSPSAGYPTALPPTHTPPIFTKPLPLHQRHSSHSTHFHPPPLRDEVFPPSFIKALQETRKRTHMSYRLELYLSDIFSATRHHPRLDAMLLTARSKQDAEDLVRASRVIGRDLTGMELLRPPIVPNANEDLSAHESEDLISEDYVRLSRLQSTTTASESLPTASHEDLGGENNGNSDKTPETRILDVSEVDIARIVPRVISHRIRVRNGPEDEVLASVLYGATFKPKIPEDAMSDAELATASKLQSVKAVLVHILSEV